MDLEIGKHNSTSEIVFCQVSNFIDFDDLWINVGGRYKMLRYLKAVQMMKQIIEENNLTVMCTIARYACTYQAIAKTDQWDESQRCLV